MISRSKRDKNNGKWSNDVQLLNEVNFSQGWPKWTRLQRSIFVLSCGLILLDYDAVGGLAKAVPSLTA